jgi:hypothetical protein
MSSLRHGAEIWTDRHLPTIWTSGQIHMHMVPAMVRGDDGRVRSIMEMGQYLAIRSDQNVERLFLQIIRSAAQIDGCQTVLVCLTRLRLVHRMLRPALPR